MNRQRNVVVLVLILLNLPAFASTKASPQVNKTLAEFRTLAAALESYASEHKRYPAATNYTELKSLVSPRYVLIETDIVDGWGSEFAYSATGDGCHYRIVSRGSDRVFEPESLKMSAEAPEKRVGKSDAADLLLQDGAFRWVPVNGEFAFQLEDGSTFSCP